MTKIYFFSYWLQRCVCLDLPVVFSLMSNIFDVKCFFSLNTCLSNCLKPLLHRIGTWNFSHTVREGWPSYGHVQAKMAKMAKTCTFENIPERSYYHFTILIKLKIPFIYRHRYMFFYKEPLYQGWASGVP